VRGPGYALLLVGLFLLGCGQKKESAAAKSTNSAASSGNPITAPVDYLGAVGAAKRTAVKVIDTAYLNQQILLFHEQEDRYPKDLKELVTMHYVNAMPSPPYGMRFDYNPETGQLKVVKK
jgi:hypothetical protein